MSRAATSTLFFTIATAGPPFEASENAPKPAPRASATPSRINTNRRRRPVSLNSISMRGKLLDSLDGVTAGTTCAKRDPTNDVSGQEGDRPDRPSGTKGLRLPLLRATRYACANARFQARSAFPADRRPAQRDRQADRWTGQGAEVPDAARRDRHGQDDDRGVRHREAPAPDARPVSQQ